jgi:hypothetical protein
MLNELVSSAESSRLTNFVTLSGATHPRLNSYQRKF